MCLLGRGRAEVVGEKAQEGLGMAEQTPDVFFQVLWGLIRIFQICAS